MAKTEIERLKERISLLERMPEIAKQKNLFKIIPMNSKIELISVHGGKSTSELAKRLKCSRANVYKLIDSLKGLYTFEEIKKKFLGSD